MSDTSQRALVRLQARIRACTKCVEAGYLPTAFPIVAGKARDRVMIISQAPGAIELTTGLPFSGRAGAELRRWLAQAGVDEAHLPYRTSVTKCFPGKAATGAVGTLAIERLWRRAPLRDVVGKCRIDGDRVLIRYHIRVVLLGGSTSPRTGFASGARSLSSGGPSEGLDIAVRAAKMHRSR